MSGEPMNPTIRVRITHRQTAKGWRVDETTVEITDSLFAPDVMEDMPPSLAQAHADGKEEANRRNREDGYDA